MGEGLGDHLAAGLSLEGVVAEGRGGAGVDPRQGRGGAAPASAVTISRAAEILGEDEEFLWDMSTDMEPEDGCL